MSASNHRHTAPPAPERLFTSLLGTPGPDVRPWSRLKQWSAVLVFSMAVLTAGNGWISETRDASVAVAAVILVLSALYLAFKLGHDFGRACGRVEGILAAEITRMNAQGEHIGHHRARVAAELNIPPRKPRP